MKFHDRSRSVMPDATVLVPLFVLFITSLSGPNIEEAFRRSLHLFSHGWPAAIMWIQVLILDIAVYAFFFPVFKVHIKCMKCCEQSGERVDIAMRRLNHIRRFVILASVTTFVVGRYAMHLVTLGDTSMATAPGDRSLFFLEAAISGFFVGVILALQFEDRLYNAKETILRLGTTERLGYSSLYSKLALILLAIATFMTLQTFSFLGNVVSLMQAYQGPPTANRTDFMSAPDLLFYAGQFAGLKDMLKIFFFRTIALGAFVVQMLFQLKRLIARPLATIHGRLEALNSPDPGAGKVIDIVQNDEFAAVYRQINELIGKQLGRLETSERRLNDIVSSAADPIIAFDNERHVVLYNPAAERLFGYPAKTVLGSGLSRFLGAEATAFTVMAESSRVPEDGTPARSLARFPWLRADGTTVPVESHLSRTGDGEDSWTTVILRDVSRQAEIEDTLRGARIEAETANRMKSEFLANMSHELRTPLNAVLGFTQLIENDHNLTDTQRDRLRVISRSGEHLLALINDILDISKIEAGKMELHESVFDLNELIHDLRDMFELKCRKNGLNLYVDTIEGLPLHVRGDIGKLRQVLVNLLGNAVKFTAEGGVGILVGPDGDRIRFAVRDTGRGIPVDEQESILQPFVQAKTTDHEGGTGLGLAISSRYVAMMGGSIAVKSSPGEGSEFSFELPLIQVENAPTPQDDGDVEIEVRMGTVALVVDDQEANRIVLKEMLERVGFTVVEAKNGREALDRAAAIHPAIVFMDIKMPVMDGYAAVAAIKGDSSLPACRVFALTASAFSHDRKRIEAAGFDGFLAKPFKQGTLYRLVADRGGVPVTVRRPIIVAGDTQSPVIPEAVSFALAAETLGVDGLERLDAAASINDFAGLSGMAAEFKAAAPVFAAALGAAAAAFDEEKVQGLLSGLGGRLRGNGTGGEHGR